MTTKTAGEKDHAEPADPIKHGVPTKGGCDDNAEVTCCNGRGRCARPTIAPSVASAQIKVGITVSASGPGAALGQPQMRTVQALPKEIAGQKVTYIALDDESDPTKAVQNARKLITEEKVDILIGSSLTPVSLPLIDIAHETKTPLLTLAAAAVMVQPLDDKKKWVYKVVPNDDLMAKVILAHIAKSGVKKLGYIGVSDGYGEGYYKELSRLAPDHGHRADHA